MKYFFLETNALNDLTRKHAGSKARIDTDFTLQKLGYSPIVIDFISESNGENFFLSIKEHFNKFLFLKEKINVIKANDELVIQFPMVNHSIFLFFLVWRLIKRGVRVTLLVHDIEILRLAIVDNVTLKRKIRLALEELSILKLVSKIIVHNSKMKKFLSDKFKIKNEKMIELNIFDYLISDNVKSNIPLKELPIIIAGNLSPEKAGYISDLPVNIDYNLYGIGYQGEYTHDNVSYKGAFLPDELIENLSGSFGLVWDGKSADTCSGVYGNYLRYNNSHKASLYLAAGYPIIVWKESALSEFVEKYQCGISVSSLHELKNKIDHLSDEEYSLLIHNTNYLSLQLKNGFFLKKALEV